MSNQQFTAYCQRNGVIVFEQGKQDFYIPLITGYEPKVRAIIEVTSRHTKTKPTQFLVPGVPEAEHDDAAFDATLQYKNWIAPRLEDPFWEVIEGAGTDKQKVVFSSEDRSECLAFVGDTYEEGEAEELGVDMLKDGSTEF